MPEDNARPHHLKPDFQAMNVNVSQCQSLRKEKHTFDWKG